MPLLRKFLQGTKVAWAFAHSLAELVVRRPKDRRARAEWLTVFCRRVLRAVHLSWSASGPVPEKGVVITNHLTYVDILLHAALRPCVFVSAIETRKMPLIGWISMMAGTVYVTRGAGGSAAQAAEGMSAGLRDGLPVVFFPEGKTGVGDEPVLPLRSGLLANAIEERAPITPGFIRYTLSPADVAAGRSTRNDVHWGDQTLPAHLWNLLGLQPISGQIQFASEPIHFSPEALVDRKIAAEEAHAALLQLSGDTNIR